MHITLLHTTQYLWWLSLVACIGLVIAIVRWAPIIRDHLPEWTVTIGVLLLLFVSFVRFSIATVGAGHARYLFPAAFSIGAILIVGLNSVFNSRYERLISLVVSFGMAAYAIWLPATFLAPKYAPPTLATPHELEQTADVNRHIASGVDLVGYTTSNDRVFPGQWLPVTLYWQAYGDPEKRQDLRVIVELRDKAGNAVAASDAVWPVPSVPPELWQPNVVYVSQTSLGLPSGELPAQLCLTIAALPGSSEEQARQGIDTIPVDLEEIVTVGGASPAEAEKIPRNHEAVFSSTVKLIGAEYAPRTILPGDTLAVTLYWQVLVQPPADYTVFIHVLNDHGNLVAQFDRPAGGNTYPTSNWQVGQLLRDSYPVLIPPEIPAGTYSVRMGMYIWPSMERLSVSSASEAIKDNSIELATLVIRSH